MNGSEKLLELAKAQIGYQEKAGAVGLDDPRKCPMPGRIIIRNIPGTWTPGD